MKNLKAIILFLSLLLVFTHISASANENEATEAALPEALGVAEQQPEGLPTPEPEEPPSDDVADNVTDEDAESD